MKKMMIFLFLLLGSIASAEEAIPEDAEAFLKAFFAGKGEEVVKLVAEKGVKENGKEGSAKKCVSSWTREIAEILKDGGTIKHLKRTILSEANYEKHREEYAGLKVANLEKAVKAGFGVVCVLEVSWKDKTKTLTNYFAFAKEGEKLLLTYIADD